MAQAILADTFPPAKRGLAFALYGITIVCAPAVGPTFGGWITDNYSWRWIFLHQCSRGILAVLLVYQLLKILLIYSARKREREGSTTLALLCSP